MFSVYSNLRAMSTKPSTTINIHRSGWKVKLDGALPSGDDKGVEALVAGQSVDTSGRIDTKVTGKIDTESHATNVSFQYPLKAELLATVRGEVIQAKATIGVTVTATEEQPKEELKPTPKAKKGKAKDAPAADEVVVDRGGVDAALNGSHGTVETVA